MRTGRGGLHVTEVEKLSWDLKKKGENETKQKKKRLYFF